MNSDNPIKIEISGAIEDVEAFADAIRASVRRALGGVRFVDVDPVEYQLRSQFGDGTATFEVDEATAADMLAVPWCTEHHGTMLIVEHVVVNRFRGLTKAKVVADVKVQTLRGSL